MADQNTDQGARGDEISAPGLAGGGGGGGGANERVMRWGMVVSPSSCGLPVTIDGNTVTNTGPWVANHDRPAQNARKKSILTLFGDKPMIPNTYFELQLHKRCDTHIGVATRDPCFRTPEVAGDATLLCLAGTNACVYTTYNGQTCSSDPRGRVEKGPKLAAVANGSIVRVVWHSSSTGSHLEFHVNGALSGRVPMALDGETERFPVVTLGGGGGELWRFSAVDRASDDVYGP